MTTIYVAKIHNKLLGETKVDVLFYRNKKMYRGPLFWNFEDDKATGDRVVRYLENQIINIEGEMDTTREDMECYATYLTLCDKYGITKYNSTLSTMKHWSFMNGFTEIYHNGK